MDRRGLAFVLAAAVLVVALGLSVGLRAEGDREPQQRRAPRSSPNVLIVVTDDQRGDAMWVLPKTKREFEQDGVRFTQAFATTPLCCPSRASIFTGMYAHNHGVKTNADAARMDPDKTLQFHLQRRGYRTAIFGKYLNGWRTAPPHFDEWAVISTHRYRGAWNVDGELKEIGTYSTTYVRQHALRFLREAERDDDRPWLLVLTPQAPHPPATPEERYTDATLPAARPNPAQQEQDLSDKPPYFRSIAAPADDAVAEAREQQLRTLMSVDDLVGATFAELAALGEERDTLAFYLSDNGFTWGEHNLFGNAESKNSPYEQSIRIPLFVKWPAGLDGDRVDDRLAANIDVAPTVFDAAGIRPAIERDGRSLLRRWERPYLLLERWRTQHAPMIPDWASLWTGTGQYVEYSDDGTITARAYYDLVEDPWQLDNLLTDENPVNDQAARRLHHALRKVRYCSGAGCP
ncbi:MAG TPA: sulfatase [Actinomycetota bacterium]|nr:sulfatase [Actinomycetota bacterium]